MNPNDMAAMRENERAEEPIQLLSARLQRCERNGRETRKRAESAWGCICHGD